MKKSNNSDNESGLMCFLMSDFAFILEAGLLFFFVASAIRDLFTCDPFFIDKEKIAQIIPIYATVNVAILSIAPVFVEYVKKNVKSSITRKKRDKFGRAINGLLDSFCQGTIIWSVILLILCVLNLIFQNSVFFAFISSFELSLVMIDTLAICIMSKSSWPETYVKNSSKKE